MDNTEQSFAILFYVVIALIGACGLLIVFVLINSAAARRASSILRVTPLQLVLFGMVMLLIFSGLGLLSVVFSLTLKFGLGYVPFRVFWYFAAAFFAIIVVLIVISIVANRQRLHAQAASDEQARLVLERIRQALPLEQPLFVYLRPFSALKERTLTEELVIQLFEQRGILVCVDEPGLQSGMGRLALRDDEWQSAVLQLCERAACIVMYPGASGGVLWELEHISNHGWLDHTLFFMPPSLMNPNWVDQLTRFLRFWMRRFPSSGDPERLREIEMEMNIRGHWERARARAREIGVNLPVYCGEGGTFRIKSGELEKVTAFARDILFGKSPRRSLESLGPVVDAYSSRTSSVPGRSKASTETRL